MKNPTSNSPDLYMVGDDYPQSPISAYFKEESYKDGIYTELADSISGIKDPAGLNKRILDVLPQSAWAEPEVSGTDAIFSDDYATAEVIENV